MRISDCLDDKTKKELSNMFKKRGKSSHENLSQRDIEELMGHSSYKRIRGAVRQVR